MKNGKFVFGRFGKGFTLIELLVVFAVIGIVTSAGMVSFSRYSTSQALKSSTGDVVSLLSNAKINAVTQSMLGSCTQQLLKYSVKVTSNRAYEMDVYCNSNSYPLKPQNLPNGVTFTTWPNEVYFLAGSGTSQGGAIIINGANGSTKQIIIDAAGNITAL